MEPRSVRLNSENRKLFVDTAIENIMPWQGRPTVNNFYAAWKSRIYDYIYGPYKELMTQLPSWATVKTEAITVVLGTEKLVFPLPNPMLAFDNGVIHRCHLKDNLFTPVCTLDEHDPLTLEFQAAIQQTTDWITKRCALRAELNKVVDACNTSAQLYQAWPKSLEFADCFPYKGSKTAPKVKISSAALDITVNIAKTTIGSPSEN